MKSPFPGMDPYLEAHWRDIHQRFITHASERLQPKLPRDLRARVEERVFVHSAERSERSVYPDVRVIERPMRPEWELSAEAEGGGVAVAEAVAVAEPIVIHLQDEIVAEGFIEIREIGSGRVVTVVEVISMANKLPGEGRDQYLRKQSELREGGVSLVEIDLLRAGQRVFAVPPESIPPSHRTPYQVCVRRAWKAGDYEIYALPLRMLLPAIRVPLRETDRDVLLDLQSLIDQCYAGGAYDDIDYAAEPNPPLSTDDAAWADVLLKEKKLREA